MAKAKGISVGFLMFVIASLILFILFGNVKPAYCDSLFTSGDFTYNLFIGQSGATEAEVVSYLSSGPKEVVIPSTVTVGGSDVPVTGIKNRAWNTGAFYNLGITSVVLPDSIKHIGHYAFNTNQLTTITIPNSVIYIGMYAFSSNQLTEAVIGNNVKNIEYWAFGNNQITSVNLGTSVTDIGQNAFLSNMLEHVTIPNSVTTIKSGAFAHNKLTSVSIGDGVTSLNGFHKNNLTQVTIPDSVTTIGAGAFMDNSLTSVIIPEEVTDIGDGAFRNNQLTTVSIPDSVLYMGEAAFMNNKLISVSIGQGLTSISNSAFCENQITGLNIPNGVRSIGDYAFQKNAIASLSIGSSVESIGDYAFAENNLTEVNIPDSVKSIGNYAFYQNAITALSIGSSVESIGDYAFALNPLTELTLPDGLLTIGQGAFLAGQLTEITIPDSVTSIDESAFGGNQLTKAIIRGSNISIGDDAFVDYNRQNPQSLVISGIKGSGSEDYAVKYGHSFIEISDTTEFSLTLSVAPAEGGSVTGSGLYAETSGVTITASPNEGFKFANWTEGEEIVSNSALYSFIITGNRILQANFAPITSAAINSGIINFNKATSADIAIPIVLNDATAVADVTNNETGIGEENYNFAEGVLTINAVYLRTLDAKTYSFEVLFDVGNSAEITINISEAGSLTSNLEVWPAAEGYEFHLRNLIDTSASSYYAAVYSGNIPYIGSSGTVVNIQFDKKSYEDAAGNTCYEYVSIPIVTEIFPVNLYEMKFFIDSSQTQEAFTSNFMIFPMVHITQPRLYDSTSSQNIDLKGYISNYSSISTLSNLFLNFNNDSNPTSIESALNTSGEFTWPLTLQTGDNSFAVSLSYTSSLTSNISHQIQGEISLITDQCFIATAAYGSKFEPSVALLRQFRDKCLLSNSMGSKFVGFYYNNSPPVANIIAGNEVLKFMVRILLVPFIGVAYLMLYPIFSLMALLSALLIIYIKKFRIPSDA